MRRESGKGRLRCTAEYVCFAHAHDVGVLMAFVSISKCKQCGTSTLVIKCKPCDASTHVMTITCAGASTHLFVPTLPTRCAWQVLLACGPQPKLSDLAELASRATGIEVGDMVLAKYVICKDGRCVPVCVPAVCVSVQVPCNC